MADVFISYASQDRERAALLAHALERAGVSVWWDRTLAPGDQFQSVIDDEIAAAKVVIVCWSPGAIASDWVREQGCAPVK